MTPEQIHAFLLWQQQMAFANQHGLGVNAPTYQAHIMANQNSPGADQHYDQPAHWASQSQQADDFSQQPWEEEEVVPETEVQAEMHEEPSKEVLTPEQSPQPAQASPKQAAEEPPVDAHGKRLYSQATRWTTHEVLILISEKRKADEAASQKGARAQTMSAKEKWSGIEDGMWGQGVYRSGHSGKNKWDNMLGEFKKVKDYEPKRPSG